MYYLNKVEFCCTDTVAITILLGRPNVSSEGLMFYPWCFFLFLSPRDLRAPSADRRETLPHDRNVGAPYNASPKIRGPSPQRNWGPKTCKIWRDFRPFQTLIANISGTGQDIQNQKTYFSRPIPPAFQEKSCELWSTNYRELDVSLDPPKFHFSGDYISAPRGCWPLKF